MAPFILLRETTTLLVMTGARRCSWGSLYVDDHGEEDRHLRRGKALYLSLPRLQQLRRMVAEDAMELESRVLARATRVNGLLY